MKVILQNIRCEKFEVEVNAHISVLQFKEIVAEKTAIEIINQTLIYAGQVLEDQRILAEYNIDNRVVQVMVKKFDHWVNKSKSQNDDKNPEQHRIPKVCSLLNEILYLIVELEYLSEQLNPNETSLQESENKIERCIIESKNLYTLIREYKSLETKVNIYLDQYLYLNKKTKDLKSELDKEIPMKVVELGYKVHHAVNVVGMALKELKLLINASENRDEYLARLHA